MSYRSYGIADQDSLRSINRAKILRLLFENGPMPRNLISEIIGMTRGSVTRIVSECIEANLIAESPPSSNTGKEKEMGRRPVPIYLEKGYYYVLAVHLGLDWLDIGVMNLQGEFDRHVRVDRPDGEPEELFEYIHRTMMKLAESEKRKLLAVGIALNSWVDSDKGIILGFNFLNWKNVNIGSWFEDKMNVPVFVDNNVYAMAMSEYFKHYLSEKDSMLFVHVGNTIGMAKLMNGSVLRGDNGLAGFLEHVPWFSDGYECECGIRGCLTSVLSSRSMIQHAQRIAPQLKIKNFQQLMAHSAEDDRIKKLVEDRAVYLGRLLAQLVAIHDPSHLILHGTCTDEEQLRIIRQSFQETFSNLKRKHIDITVSEEEEGQFISVAGAGVMALRHVFSPALQLVLNRNNGIEANL